MQKLPGFLAKRYLKKRTFQGNINRKQSIANLKKNIFPDFNKPQSKIKSFIENLKNPDVKDYSQMKNQKATEFEILLLEQAVKLKRGDNKSMVKSIQETEQLLRNFEVMKLKIQNQKFLTRLNTTQNQTNKALEFLKGLTKKTESTSNDNFVKSLKAGLLNIPNFGNISGEVREDKLKERQNKAIDNLMNEGIEKKKLYHQLQNVIDLLKGKMSETEKEETLLKEQLQKLENLKQKNPNMGKSSSISSRFKRDTNPKQIPDAFRKLIQSINKIKSKNDSSVNNSILHQNNPNRSMQKNSLQFYSNSKNDSFLGGSEHEGRLRSIQPAFRPAKRVSFFSKFSHFSGSVENNPLKSLISHLKQRGLSERKKESARFSMVNAFTALKHKFKNNKKRNMFGSLNKGNVEKSKKFTKRLIDSIIIKNKKRLKKDPLQSRVSKRKLEKQIRKFLRNKFHTPNKANRSIHISKDLDYDETLSLVLADSTHGDVPRSVSKLKKKIAGNKKLKSGKKMAAKNKSENKRKKKLKHIKRIKRDNKSSIKRSRSKVKRKPSKNVKKLTRSGKINLLPKKSKKSKSKIKKPKLKKEKTKSKSKPKMSRSLFNNKVVNLKKKKSKKKRPKSLKKKRKNDHAVKNNFLTNLGVSKTMTKALGNPNQISFFSEQNNLFRTNDFLHRNNFSIVEESLLLTSKHPSSRNNIKLLGSKASESLKSETKNLAAMFLKLEKLFTKKLGQVNDTESNQNDSNIFENKFIKTTNSGFYNNFDDNGSPKVKLYNKNNLGQIRHLRTPSDSASSHSIYNVPSNQKVPEFETDNVLKMFLKNQIGK